MTDAVRPEPSRMYRWIVLVVVSLTMFGNYYVYDCISPIADLLSKQLGFSNANIGLLQAIYSIPNVFMVLIGGYIVDRIGTRKGILIFGTLCLLGSILTVSAGKLADHGGGAAGVRDRRGIADRGGHDGDREMVSRQGTELRLRD